MMNYQIANNLNENNLLILGFFSDEALSEAHSYNLEAYLDTPLKPQKSLSTLFYHHAQRPVLLINLGKKEKWSQKQLSTASKKIAASLKPLDIHDVDVCLPPVNGDSNQTAKDFILAMEYHSYQFTRCKSKQEETKTLSFSILADANQEILSEALAISKGVKKARDLGNLPANLCTPGHLVEEAKELAKSYSKLKATILDEKQMRKMGMNTLLSVSRGSDESAYLIDLRYQNGGDMAPIVLVGKGITFDSGGLSLKPPKGMEEMKFDMCGAASVLGVMKAVCELELPINLNVLVATSENLPGPTATRPGDVIESYSKQTVEILNTDAEGRLVLCDALTYAEQFEPQCVIDIATLTGAIIISLGHHTNGIMGNDDELCQSLLMAGRKANDKGWQLPLWDEYQDMLKSNVADIANISSGGGAGSITAGCFLSRFAKKYAWAHIDIAGTAWQSGKDKCATGRPVPLLMQFLFDKIS